MKVTVTKYGGQTAGMRLPPQAFDLTKISDADTDDFLKLLTSLKNAMPSIQRMSNVSPDAMSYDITVEDANSRSVFHQSDSNMSQPFADLLDWLELLNIRGDGNHSS